MIEITVVDGTSKLKIPLKMRTRLWFVAYRLQLGERVRVIVVNIDFCGLLSIVTLPSGNHDLC